MKPLHMAICAALSLALSCGAAMTGAKAGASTPSAPAQSGLPGVDGGYSIVTPLPPEPDDQPRSGQFGHFKVGDFDVKVSGKLTFDIGVGSLRPPKR